MGKFWSEMIDLGIEASAAYYSSKKKVSKASEIFKRLISKEEIDVAEFKSMYETRIHDFDTKQDDIKIMKKYDFEGVYIIHNCTKNIFLVGKSKSVLKKVDRQFRGFENNKVYKDYEYGDEFKVRIIRFESSGYDNIDKLENDIKSKYGTYSSKIDNISSLNKNNNITGILFTVAFL